MRRFFLRPTALRVLLAMIGTFGTYLYANAESAAEAKHAFGLGVSIAYLWIGPENPILKFLTLLVFWFIVSWLTYIVIYLLELLYVKSYNAIVIKTKFINK